MEKQINTLSDQIEYIGSIDLPPTLTRDMISAIKRIAEMTGQSPATIAAAPPVLCEVLASIRPAAHRITPKTFANQRSLLCERLNWRASSMTWGTACRRGIRYGVR